MVRHWLSVVVLLVHAPLSFPILYLYLYSTYCSGLTADAADPECCTETGVETDETDERDERDKTNKTKKLVPCWRRLVNLGSHSGAHGILKCYSVVRIAKRREQD